MSPRLPLCARRPQFALLWPFTLPSTQPYVKGYVGETLEPDAPNGGDPQALCHNSHSIALTTDDAWTCERR